MQIIVLGMHRSRTSLVAGLIHSMGVYVGDDASLMPSAPDNPKGFFERSDVMAVDDAMLNANDTTWNRLIPWLENGLAPLSNDLARRLDQLIDRLDVHRPWLAKDPRLCLTLPHWKPRLTKPVFVVVHRDPLEVAASLASRDGFSIEYGLALWECYSVGLLNAVGSEPCLFVETAQILQRPWRSARRLHAELQERAVQGLKRPPLWSTWRFVDRRLYRSRTERSTSNLHLSEAQAVVEARLRGVGPRTLLSASPSSIEAIRRWIDDEDRGRL